LTNRKSYLYLKLYLCASVSSDFMALDKYNAYALLAMQTAVLATGFRPSVIPSHSGVLSRRMNIRSRGFQHVVIYVMIVW